MQPWLLPENIADVLPNEARRIEDLRRRLLDLYRSYGFELVIPPMIEHLDSLLTGSGSDLGLRTFKLVDQMSGRTLGVRADITPQVARIDAHLLNREGLARLCYAGSVLHARASGPFANREPMHIGAEIYGHAGIEADLEVIDLLVRSLSLAGCSRIRLDLSHVGIVPALLERFGRVPGLDEEGLYRLLQGKDVPGLRTALAAAPAPLREALLGLTGLHGRIGVGQDAQRTRRGLGPSRQDVCDPGQDACGSGQDVHSSGKHSATRPDPLARARDLLPDEPAIIRALDDLERFAGSTLWQRWPEVEVSVDLADLRGYRYHTGLTFGAYVEHLPYAIARGGRYDGAGSVFGRARAATGFSIELRALADVRDVIGASPAICAPWSDDPALLDRIAELRSSGEVVIQILPGSRHEQQEFVCDRELVEADSGWIVRTLNGN